MPDLLVFHFYLNSVIIIFMKNIKIYLLAFLLLPSITFAAELSGTKDLIRAVGDLIQLLTIIVAAIALLVFLWGLAMFIFKLGGDEKAVESGRTLMIWGVVALFVMVSVWGLVAFMQRELGLPVTTSPGTLPSTFNSPYAPFPSSPSGGGFSPGEDI